jgi:hypothetical protein
VSARTTIIPPPSPPPIAPILVMIDAYPMAKVISVDPNAFAMPKVEVARELSNLVRRWVKENTVVKQEQ